MALRDVVSSAAVGKGNLKKLFEVALPVVREVPFLDANAYLRVSALADLCAREEVIAAATKKTRSSTVDANLKFTFAHGSALHWALQNEIMPDTGCFLGVWRCIDCAKQFGHAKGFLSESQGLVRRPKKCDSCGSSDFRYKEQSFVNEEYRIGGHPDGFLVMQGMPGIGIAEFKSVGPKMGWEVRDSPIVGHAVQLQAYLWLTGLPWGKILYWEKAGFGLQAIHEHTVERDEDTIESIKALIRSIWKGIETGALPDRICMSSTCPRAKACSLTRECFAVQVPALEAAQ